MALCLARASAAIVQQVPPEAAEWFVEWQHGVSAVAEGFDGYQGTDVYPPSDGQRNEWVAVVHFEDDLSLERWINSPQRAQWVSRLQAKVGEFELKTLKGGFSEWFAGVNKAGGDVPSWKMAFTVLFGLYPTVMLLTIFVTPYTSGLGLAFSMLIGNALSVAFLQWVGVPALEVPLGPWLQANSPSKKILSWAGLVGLLVLLTAIAAVFRLVTG